MTASRHGWLAEFATPEALVRAARSAHVAGYRAEAYSPFPIEGLNEALGRKPPRIPWWTLAGAVLGGVAGYALQWYAATVDLPLNIGGRPLHSAPMFVPVAFEMAVLGGAVAALAAMLWQARLPRLHHPLFALGTFDLASRHRFFLVVRHDDPVVPRWLEGLQPLRCEEVPA